MPVLLEGVEGTVGVVLELELDELLLEEAELEGVEVAEQSRVAS